MTAVLALLVGGLYAAGLYVLLHRSIVKLIIGLALLNHAANLLIFTADGLTRGDAPIVPAGAAALRGPHADPLPHALILTAIVIGFGIQAFALILIRRTHQTTGTDDVDRMRSSE